MPLEPHWNETSALCALSGAIDLYGIKVGSSRVRFRSIFRLQADQKLLKAHGINSTAVFSSKLKPEAFAVYDRSNWLPPIDHDYWKSIKAAFIAELPFNRTSSDFKKAYAKLCSDMWAFESFYRRW